MNFFSEHSLSLSIERRIMLILSLFFKIPPISSQTVERIKLIFTLMLLYSSGSSKAGVAGLHVAVGVDDGSVAAVVFHIESVGKAGVADNIQAVRPLGRVGGSLGSQQGCGLLGF